MHQTVMVISPGILGQSAVLLGQYRFCVFLFKLNPVVVILSFWSFPKARDQWNTMQYKKTLDGQKKKDTDFVVLKPQRIRHLPA